MHYDRTVIGYHGCDHAVAERLLAGAPFKESVNDYDWLGRGIYFWEYGLDRALQFAEDQKRRGKVKKPAVVGALLQLGNCFDLMDTRFTQLLEEAYPVWRAGVKKLKRTLPTNRGHTKDRLLRDLDCAVMNWLFDTLSAQAVGRYDCVRSGFVEGPPCFPGSGISTQSHVQIAVRNPDCIVGVFRPRMIADVARQEEA
jgi:hypothetical protein